jgi:hypothetical protein
LQDLLKLLQQVADVQLEAEALAGFLGEVCNNSTLRAGKPGLIAVIHGRETGGDIHKFAQKRGVLSVASPFCKLALNFDIRFGLSSESSGLDVLINSKKKDLIAPALKSFLTPHGTVLTTKYDGLLTKNVFPDLSIQGQALASLNTICADTAAYPAIMSGIIEVMRRLFPGVVCFHAEQSKRIPWTVPWPQAAASGEVAS